MEREGVLSPAETLMEADPGPGQQCRILRKIEGVAVPVEHEGLFRTNVPDRRFIARGRKNERRPADFLLAVRIDPGAERAGNELRAEADSERGLIGRKALLEACNLVLKEWIEIILIGADGSTENDEQIRRQKINCAPVSDRRFDITDPPTPRVEKLGQDPKIFKGNVPDHGNADATRLACTRHRKLLL